MLICSSLLCLSSFVWNSVVEDAKSQCVRRFWKTPRATSNMSGCVREKERRREGEREGEEEEEDDDCHFRLEKPHEPNESYSKC